MRKRVTKYGGTPLKSALIWQEVEEFKARNATVKFKANLWATLFAKKKRSARRERAGKRLHRITERNSYKRLEELGVSVLLVC